MKVLLVSNFVKKGGDSVFVSYLQQLLIENGIQADVFLAGNKLAHAYNFFVGTNPFLLHRFRKAARDYDVVHFHNISRIGYNILQKKAAYKSIYTCHDHFLVCPCSDMLCRAKSCISCSLARRRLQLARVSGAFQQGVNSLDTITAPSRYMQAVMRDKLGREIAFLPNFADPEFSEQRVAYSDYFLYVGKVSREKGSHDLVRCFKKSKKNLVVIGEPHLDTKAENIIQLGWQDKDIVFSYMKNANALIVPSHYCENSPMVIHEANALGTRVIARKTGGVPEIVDGHNLFTTEKELAGLIDNYSSLRLTKPVSPCLFLKKYMKVIE